MNREQAEKGEPKPTAACSVNRRRTLVLLIAILVSAFAVRAIAAVWWHQRGTAAGNTAQFQFGDTGAYWHLARTIARGEPYQFGSPYVKIFRTPGYPLILAPLFLFSDQPPIIAASFINVVFGTLAVALVFWLGRILFDTRVGLAAASLCSVYPGAIGMSVFVLSEGPFCAPALLNLIFWIKAIRTQSWKSAIGFSLLAGGCCGLAILVRPSWLLFTPFGGLLLILFAKRRIRASLNLVTMCAAICLVMLPWWIRNYQAVGHFVPTTLQTGASLYDGLNPRANGASEMSFVDPQRVEFLKQVYAEDPQTVAKLSALDKNNLARESYPYVENLPAGIQAEYEFDRYLKNRAIEWAAKNPGRSLQLALIKFAKMWTPWTSASDMKSLPMRVVILCGYLPLIVLGIWGAIRYCRSGAEYWLCILPAIYFSGLHTIFVASIRYRQPAMLPLIVLAAAVAVSLWQKRFRSDQLSLGKDGN